MLRLDLAPAHLEGGEQTTGSVEDSYDYWFDRIDLHEATLAEWNLEDTSLRGASFENADLTGASLRGTSLRSANLRGACLIGADLRNADLRNADLRGAVMGDTLLVRVDLSEVKGLQDIHHRFSSIVDVSTLELTSSGIARFPARRLQIQLEVQSFLAKCGVPNPYLALFESLVLS
jgi:uncharacterized protein YjbI with pentapeptide repeats